MTHSLEVFSFVLPSWVLAAYYFSGFIVFAEALNKLERTNLLARGLTARLRLVVAVKAIAWVLLATGGAGALVAPLMHSKPPALQDACVMVGFALLIVRTRLKEKPPCAD